MNWVPLIRLKIRPIYKYIVKFILSSLTNLAKNKRKYIYIYQNTTLYK